jgi:CTP:molybdopterin cytidylyltransferase MocA
VAPVFRGTQGTPVLFAAEVFASCVRSTAMPGAQAWCRRGRARGARGHRRADAADVDTPEDYARLHVQ